jgi:predicted RNA binding protein YcfA (HicA-like mRNA interferase family)
MAGLVGFSYDQITGKLSRLGFSLARRAKGDHEIWRNAQTGQMTTVPHCSGDMPVGTLRAILRQAQISRTDFLRA